MLYLLKRLVNWFTNPNVPPTINKKNFIRVQIDAVGIGFANAASPFLPVFLTRLGASSYAISLLSSMPALVGLLLSIPAGWFLQTRRQIVPWFGAARLLVVLAYAMTGLIPFVFSKEVSITAILVIWAVATLPQTMVAICFSVVMNAVAGPQSRFELLSRRWSILGFTTSITVVLVGQVLSNMDFPFNYQIVFLVLSLGGLISFYYSSHIELPDAVQPVREIKKSLISRITEQIGMQVNVVKGDKAFLSFVGKRLVYLTGVSISAPLFPLYFVRTIEASDAWIGIINTAFTAMMVIGYFVWTRQSRRHGSRRVLVLTTLAMSLYPALVSRVDQPWMIAIFAGLAGIFQGGLDLVFFDELMKTVPIELSATFVSAAQSLQYVSAVISPFVGSYLADHIGLSSALLVSAGVRFIGFLLFYMKKPAQ